MVNKTLIIAAVGLMCVVFLVMASVGGYYYYNNYYKKSSSSYKKPTSSSKKPTSSSKTPTPGAYVPFTSSYEKIVQAALVSTQTGFSDLFKNIQKSFLEYKANMNDGTKWYFQEQNIQVLLNEYKKENADKTTTDEYKKVMDYETEFNTLKPTRNTALVTAQCPSGAYPANPDGPNAPSQCRSLYGPDNSGVMKNRTGCKSDPKCKLARNAFGGGELCVPCDDPKLTSGIYALL
jgi:hypothetical protein